jgi:cysteine desulfurase/selenocysteine lyase
MEMSKQINKVTELTASKTGIEKCRQDFPALAQSINEHPLVYLDSAASAQQPQSVIDKVVEYQSHDHANVHRGVHTLSVRATEAYEGARDIVQKFINAGSRSEVVYTSGTTESINLVAQSFCRPNLSPGDRILITHLEHHSNIVPWQLVCDQTFATRPARNSWSLRSTRLARSISKRCISNWSVAPRCSRSPMFPMRSAR